MSPLVASTSAKESEPGQEASAMFPKISDCVFARMAKPSFRRKRMGRGKGLGLKKKLNGCLEKETQRVDASPLCCVVFMGRRSQRRAVYEPGSVTIDLRLEASATARLRARQSFR